MSNFDLIRAWKDEDFSSSLSEAQRSQLPESPVGSIELLSDEEMELLAGGINNVAIQNNNVYGDNNNSVADNGSQCVIFSDDYNYNYGYGHYWC